MVSLSEAAPTATGTPQHTASASPPTRKPSPKCRAAFGSVTPVGSRKASQVMTVAPTPATSVGRVERISQRRVEVGRLPQATDREPDVEQQVEADRDDGEDERDPRTANAALWIPPEAHTPAQELSVRPRATSAWRVAGARKVASSVSRWGP